MSREKESVQEEFLPKKLACDGGMVKQIHCIYRHIGKLLYLMVMYS